MTLDAGTRVRLLLCPFGQPGVVLGQNRGKIVVEWTDLEFTGRHRPEDLVLEAGAV